MKGTQIAWFAGAGGGNLLKCQLVEAFLPPRSRGESLTASWAKVFLGVKQRQGGGGRSSRMARRPRGKLVDGEVEGERERLRGEKQEVEGERVTFDDVLAELGEFGREQKVNIYDFVTGLNASVYTGLNAQKL